jgi:hypothetical protein
MVLCRARYLPTFPARIKLFRPRDRGNKIKLAKGQKPGGGPPIGLPAMSVPLVVGIVLAISSTARHHACRSDPIRMVSCYPKCLAAVERYRG